MNRCRVWEYSGTTIMTIPQIPRGRVAWNINKFIVLVGKWAEPIQDELASLIEKEFSLPYFELVYEPMEQQV